MPPRNAQQIMSQHKRIERALQAGIRQALKGAGDIAVMKARTDPGFKVRTGKTTASVFSRVTSAGPTQNLVFGSENKVANYMNGGTERHIIAARGLAIAHGRLLKFYWERIGKDWAGPYVNHPGTKPTRFLQRAGLLCRDTLTTKLYLAARKALRT